MVLSRSRIAVIGAGCGGLTAAWLLNRSHEVTVFEKNDYLGGHTNTLVIPDGPDAGTPVDTGFIVYNRKNYPSFCRLLELLNVEGAPSDMSFGFSSDRDNIEYSSYVPRGLFARKRNLFRPRFLSMIRDILRFNREASQALHRGELAGMTLGDYLKANRYKRSFMDWYLIPMGAAIWSTPLEKMLEFPAETYCQFFENHGLLALEGRPQWMYVPGGSQTYVRAIRENLKGAIHTGAEVLGVRRTPDNVIVREAKLGELEFDYVVIGAHADEALALLDDPGSEEKRLLGPWRYTKNRAVLHTDASLMPRRKAAWASWNVTDQGSTDPLKPVTLTYWMNRLQRLMTTHPYFVTLNHSERLAGGSVIREIEYTHPMYTFESVKTQEELPKLNGLRRTFFCGSYFGYGFHEDAVKSGALAASWLGEIL